MSNSEEFPDLIILHRALSDQLAETPPSKEYAPIVLPPVYWRIDPREGLGTLDYGSMFVIDSGHEFPIYGRKVSSSYQEDLAGIENAEANEYMMGEWFSVACPQGEVGTNHASRIVAITQEEFLAAYKNGWLP